MLAEPPHPCLAVMVSTQVHHVEPRFQFGGKTSDGVRRYAVAVEQDMAPDQWQVVHRVKVVERVSHDLGVLGMGTQQVANLTERIGIHGRYALTWID